jgi:serine/threonine protein kinase
MYAMKKIAKSQVVAEGLKDMVMNEKKMLSILDSDFVVRCHGTMKDDQFLYFLIEPALGGELFELYDEHQDWFGNEVFARFYSSCIVLGLEHMHAKKMIHRDLKLENVLLRNNGYAMLSDMGLTKIVIGKTYTMCGTADYFAPETLKQVGHNRAVDWWALGICIFVMMSGRSPFDAEDVMQIYKNIVKGFRKETFPGDFKSDLCDVIKGLCRKKPHERISMGPGGVKNLKEHMWYMGHPWLEIDAGHHEAPYIPDCSSKTLEDWRSTLRQTSDHEFPHYEDDGTGWDAEF